MPEKELNKVRTIMKKMGYSTADLLVVRYGDYRVIYLHSPEEYHAKYEGMAMIKNEQQEWKK